GGAPGTAREIAGSAAGNGDEEATPGKPSRSGASPAPSARDQSQDALNPTRSELLSEMEPHWRAPDGASGAIYLNSSGLAAVPPWIGSPGSGGCARAPDDGVDPPDEAYPADDVDPPDDVDPLPPAAEPNL